MTLYYTDSWVTLTHVQQGGGWLLGGLGGEEGRMREGEGGGVSQGTGLELWAHQGLAANLFWMTPAVLAPWMSVARTDGAGGGRGGWVGLGTGT